VAPANAGLLLGMPESFVELLEAYIEYLPVGLQYSTSEACIQYMIEPLLDPPDAHLEDLWLMMDPTSGRYGYADFFVAGTNSFALLELKLVRLSWLISAHHGKWIETPSTEDMDNFSDRIAEIDPEQIDELPYMHPKKVGEEWVHETSTVGKLRREAMAQLEGYLEVVAKGKGCSQSKDGKFKGSPGVLDSRLNMAPRKTTKTLYGFVMVVIGGKKVLCEAASPLKTQFSFKCTGGAKEGSMEGLDSD
jgi:hypothetical protein